MTETQVLARLRARRKALGMTQAEAAVRIGLAGASSFSPLETGDYSMSLRQLLALCEVYGATPVWALTGRNQTFDKEGEREMTTLGQSMILDGLAECHRLAFEKGYRFELQYVHGDSWKARFTDRGDPDIERAGVLRYDSLGECLWALIRDERERRKVREEESPPRLPD